MYITEISNRIEKWSDEEYQNKFDAAITDPDILFEFVNSASDLYFKKYIEKNNIDFVVLISIIILFFLNID